MSQRLGRAVVTYQAWDTEGTPLADPPIVFELEGSHLSQYRSVEPIYGPDGKVAELLIGATLLNITGRVIDPAHPTPHRVPVVPGPSLADLPPEPGPEFTEAVKEEGTPIPVKSIEDLEREMQDWVRGVKDEHDLAVEALKGQHIPVLEQRLAALEQTKKTLVARYDSAIAQVQVVLRHARPADPGGLTVEDGKVVDPQPVDAMTAAHRLAGIPDEPPKEG